MARGRGPWSEEACWKLSISRQKCQYLTPIVSSFDFSYKWHFQNRKILRKWHNPEWMSVTKGEPDLSKSTHGLSTGGARRGSNTEGSWSSKVCVSQDSGWYIQAQCGTYRLCVVRTGSVWYVQALLGAEPTILHTWLLLLMNSKPNLGGSSIKWIVQWEEKRTNPNQPLH